MSRTNTKLKKKAPARKKRKPAQKRPTLIPAVLFLLLTAGLLGILYLIAGTHLPIQNPAATIKPLKRVRPDSRKHRQPHQKHNKEPLLPPTAQTNPSPKLIIYRLSSDFSQLVKSPVGINRNLTDIQKAQHIFILLTQPWENSQAPLAQTTKLRSVSFKEPLITVDVSADIRNNLINSGANDEIMTIACLTNSLLKNFPEFDSLQILINGKKCRTLAGHIDISRPLTYQTGITIENN